MHARVPLRDVTALANSQSVLAGAKPGSRIGSRRGSLAPPADEDSVASVVATQRQASASGQVPQLDVDRRTAHIPKYVVEYVEDIIAHLRQRELSLERRAEYLDSQPEITERMRMILTDWLVDVHIKFKLHPETFFLAVDIVDRYLSRAQAKRSTLQLVGVTAMLLAAKHEEIWPPEVKECVYISANTYTRDEILVMERDIAEVIGFRLCVPTVYPFAVRALEALDAVPELRNLAMMFLDAAALDYGTLAFRPSVAGASAVFLASVTASNKQRARRGLPPVAGFGAGVAAPETWAEVWPQAAAVATLTEASAARAEMVRCAEGVLQCAASLLSSSARYHALRRKYTSEKFMNVAAMFELPVAL